jgi:hypothetical protein
VRRLLATSDLQRGARPRGAGELHQELHGSLHVDNIVIRLCKAYMVTSTLEIVASGNVTIDAPLELLVRVSDD